MNFVTKTLSHYTETFSFRSGVDQESIVCYHLDDSDRMDEVQASLLEHPYYRIFPENPLHLGFYLSSIGSGTLCVCVRVHAILNHR